MARQLRFQYPGAVYHVMARGDGGKQRKELSVVCCPLCVNADAYQGRGSLSLSSIIMPHHHFAKLIGPCAKARQYGRGSLIHARRHDNKVVAPYEDTTAIRVGPWISTFILLDWVAGAWYGISKEQPPVPNGANLRF